MRWAIGMALNCICLSVFCSEWQQIWLMEGWFSSLEFVCQQKEWDPEKPTTAFVVTKGSIWMIRLWKRGPLTFTAWLENIWPLLGLNDSSSKAESLSLRCFLLSLMLCLHSHPMWTAKILKRERSNFSYFSYSILLRLYVKACILSEPSLESGSKQRKQCSVIVCRLQALICVFGKIFGQTEPPWDAGWFSQREPLSQTQLGLQWPDFSSGAGAALTEICQPLCFDSRPANLTSPTHHSHPQTVRHWDIPGKAPVIDLSQCSVGV